MTYSEFKARFPGHIPAALEEDLKLFIETVLDMSDDYEHWVSRLRSSGKFKSLFGASTARQTTMTTTETVLSDKERRLYPRDLYRTITAMAQNGGKKPSGLSGAISDFLSEKNPELGNVANGKTLLVPLEALVSRKAQLSGSAPAGGFLVADEVSREIERMLRAASVCVRAGARSLPGLRGDLTLGRETAEVTYSWLAELEEVDETAPTYGAVKLSPKRLAGFTAISSQLNVQAPDLSGFVVESLSRGIGSAFDRAAIQGAGSMGEPLGLFYRENVKTLTFSGAPTWLKAVQFESQITTANCDDDSITFIAEPAVRQKWRTVERFTGGGRALWEGNLCADRQAFVTTNCASTKICAGDFSKMVFATWGEGSPVAVIVDPFSSAKSGKIELVASLMGDVGVLREEVFCISTDSAIQ